MKIFVPIVLLLALCAAGCPKRVETTVSGSDEDQLEAYSARLEEMRARAAAENLSCKDTCSLAKDACDIAGKVCEIAERSPDRGQTRCVAANEDCARFNDLCASCRP